MDGPEILIPLVLGTLGILTVLIPIAGLTARFALKPIVEAIARMREVQAGTTGRELSVLEQRVALLEQQYQALDSSVERIDPARRDASVAALCDFLHLTRRSESPPVAARVVNASDSSFPNWTQWSPEMSATLSHHCSELMQRFGYGAEPKWIELVTRGKTLAESKGGG